MKVLITGGAGFLAGALIPLLKAQGHEVVTADIKGQVDYCGDLSNKRFCNLLPDVGAVVHASAVQYIAEAELPLFGRKKFFHRNNVEVTRLLVERYRDPNIHFINVATSMIYEQSGRALYTVDSPLAPQGYYSRSKILAKSIVEKRGGLNATVIPCIIAGKGRGGLFVSLTEKISKNAPVLVPGRADHPIHVVHVEDCASLIARIVETRSTGVFNAASRDPMSIIEWIKEIEDELGAKPTRLIHLPLAPIHMVSALLNYIPVPKERLLMLKHPHVLDISDGEKIGWTPSWTNAEIVRQTARSVVDSGA